MNIKERDKNGKIKKSSGRPPGAKNKTTQEIRNKFEMLLDQNLETMQTDLDKLKSKERLDVLMNLANYVIPKLRASEMKVEHQEGVSISFNKLVNWKGEER